MRECDFAVDMEFLQHASNGQRRTDGKSFGPSQCPTGESALDRGLDLALRGDSKALEKLSELEVEDVGIHCDPPWLVIGDVVHDFGGEWSVVEGTAVTSPRDRAIRR
jgi:hypothetical protein